MNGPRGSWAKDRRLRHQAACWCRAQGRPSTALARDTTLVSVRISHRAGCLLAPESRTILMRISEWAPDSGRILGNTCKALRWLARMSERRSSPGCRYRAWTVCKGFAAAAPPQFVCPRALCVDASGDILVAEQDSQRLQVLDAIRGARKRCICIPVLPGTKAGLNGFFGVAASHVLDDGDIAIYASAPDRGCVYCFSKHTGRLTDTVGAQQLSWPTGIDLDCTRQLLAVADERSAAVWLFDMSVRCGRVINRICLAGLGGRPYDVSFNPLNTEIAVSSIGEQDNIVWFNSAHSKSHRALVPVRGVRAVVCTMDGALLVSTVPHKGTQEPDTGTIKLIRGDTTECCYRINGYSYSLAVSPAGEEALLCSYSGELLRIKAPDVVPERAALKPLNKASKPTTTAKTTNQTRRPATATVSIRAAGAPNRSKSAASTRNGERTSNVFDRLILDAKKKRAKPKKKAATTASDRQKKKSSSGSLLGIHLRTQHNHTTPNPTKSKPVKTSVTSKANVFDRLVVKKKGRPRCSGEEAAALEAPVRTKKPVRKVAVKAKVPVINAKMKPEQHTTVQANPVCIKTSFSTLIYH